MEMTDEMRFDTRLIERHMSRGRLTQAELEQHLKGLKDQADRAQSMAIQITHVGVSTVNARPTGEHE
ncbi:MAG: hypothetical protein KC613_03645 [Myxococcales bacterium]|nr:hypothetical protein [Myxococcales bacterium]MCB9524850.1 hypothetical protein [Myxococcales bacterium]